MNKMSKFYSTLSADKAVCILLFIWWVCNLLQAGFTELANDEAYYHIYAKTLDWGYYDHPPMLALIIKLGESLFSGEFGFRIFVTILQPIYLYILWILVRPKDAKTADATLFMVISASMLMLQLYGFIAVPDAPLMFFAAIFLLTYKQFLEGKKWAWLWMGISMAALAYSKYQGAIFVLFAFAANPKLFLSYKLYLSGLVAIILIIPHLVWQHNHDWASFEYHLVGRNKEFKFSYITEYILNLLVVFNLLYVPLFFQAWRKVKSTDGILRVLKFVPVAFIIFFFFSTLRGHVQPQWLIVSCFGLIGILFIYARRHPRTRKYIITSGCIMIALVGIVRIHMMVNLIGMKFEIFENKESYTELKELANGRPIIFRHRYSTAAKYNFYTKEDGYCQPNVYYRTSQWQYRDDDTMSINQEVLIESLSEMQDSTKVIESIILDNGYTFFYFIDNDFKPTRKVTIDDYSIAQEASAGEKLSFTLNISNPYSYDIVLDNSNTYLTLIWMDSNGKITESKIDCPFTLVANESVNKKCELTVAESLTSGEYRVGFAIKKVDYTFWYNSGIEKINIIE